MTSVRPHEMSKKGRRFVVINESLPIDWRDLQRQVALILSECNFQVGIEKTVQTVRGASEIDVFAVDKEKMPPITYLCECKHWSSPIPQTAVHAFRSNGCSP